MRGYVQNGANVIAVSTNDAWWDNTPGHRQLLAYTRLRAIELRRDIVRSANTGISCLINARGDVKQPLAYLSRGAVVGDIQIRESETLYTRHGDFMGGLSVLMGSMLFLFSLVFRFLKK
jgi:apolipoprotein N-acyltransferase